MNKGRKAIEKKTTALERLAIQYVPTADLQPNKYNPNRQSDHDFELLCRSIEEDGFTQPIIVSPDHTIIDGEHRWRAAKALNFTEIPVVIIDMTAEQMRISTLRHNRARGSEDVELSAQVLRDLRELGALDWAQDSLMIDDIELTRMLEDIEAPEFLAGEEYSEAWNPDHKPADENATPATGRTESMTPAAADRLREAEQNMKNAKTEEERRMIRKDADIFHLVLQFTGPEAKLVKEVLGDRPAANLVELCKTKLDAKSLSGEPATDPPKNKKGAKAAKP